MLQWLNAAAAGTLRARWKRVVSRRLACLAGRLPLRPRAVSAAGCGVGASGAQGALVLRLELTVLFAAARCIGSLLPKIRDYAYLYILLPKM